MSVKSRFCPSPTGYMHLGNARTALFSALYAFGAQGTFLLRIEDTDQSRSAENFIEAILEDLRWLGLHWQEGPVIGGDLGPYWQSQRHTIYAAFYQQLEEKKRAYPCFCSDAQLALTRKLQLSAGQPPRYAGTCRELTAADIAAKRAQGLKPALRFRVPPEELVLFHDFVRGEQRYLGEDIGDFIIRREDETASFMFCNAIDDSLMGVTHVLRGEDHLSNTPRQLMILQALNLRMPRYGHLSLITGSDGSPLSKRHGSRSIKELREAGFLPMAIVNYLARLGHTYPETYHDKMDMESLAQGFSLAAIGRAPARYDEQQLRYWQKSSVAVLTDEAFWWWCQDQAADKIPVAMRIDFVAAVRANVVFPEDIKQWIDVCFGQCLEYDEAQKTLLQSAGQLFFETALHALRESHMTFPLLIEWMQRHVNVKGKALFQPLRVALTAQLHGPEMGPIFTLMGLERARLRFEAVLRSIK